jgi:hypothetical protein
MDDDAEKLDRIEEMTLCGANARVVDDFVAELEKTFISEAYALTQKGEQDKAVRKYFWAMLLPGRALRREALMHLALFAVDPLMEESTGIDQITSLQDAVFTNLREELNQRWIQKQNRSLIEKFVQLDSEQSLLRKRFDRLQQVMQELLQPDRRTNEWLVAEVRISQEEQAQDQFKRIIERVKDIAKEEDHVRRQEFMYGEVRAMTARAVECAAGGNPVYGQQISDYVVAMENFLIRSDTEKIVADMNLEVDKSREEQRNVFNQVLRGNSDEVAILQEICGKLKVFRNDGLLEELEKLSINWVRKEGRFRFELVALNEPSRARSLVSHSLRLIQEHGETLPDEIARDFRTFLEELAARLANSAQPAADEEVAQQEVAEPPAGRRRRFTEWLRGLFTRGRSK